MREYTYRIDEDGAIWSEGVPYDDAELHRSFFRTMKRADDGRTFATCQGERCWIAPVDTPFVIDGVRVVQGPDGGVIGVTLLLKGDIEEPLDPTTLSVGEGNVMYTVVKDGSFPARFARKAYYDLARFITRDGDDFVLKVGRHSYPIAGDVQPES